jgi:hypothetical protein
VCSIDGRINDVKDGTDLLPLSNVGLLFLLKQVSKKTNVCCCVTCVLFY